MAVPYVIVKAIYIFYSCGKGTKVLINYIWTLENLKPNPLGFIYLLIFIFIYLTVPGISCGMQTLSGGIGI